jgi:hypothetical protein
MKGGLFLDVVIGQSASILQLLSCEDQALLIRGDTRIQEKNEEPSGTVRKEGSPFLILDLCLDYNDYYTLPKASRFKLPSRLYGKVSLGKSQDLKPEKVSRRDGDHQSVLCVAIWHDCYITIKLTGSTSTRRRVPRRRKSEEHISSLTGSSEEDNYMFQPLLDLLTLLVEDDDHDDEDVSFDGVIQHLLPDLLQTRTVMQERETIRDGFVRCSASFPEALYDMFLG